MSSASEFVPLRTDPPPPVTTTLWLRTVVFLAMLGATATVLVVEYMSSPGDVARHPLVLASQVVWLVLLIRWSRSSLENVAALVPATRYSADPDPGLVTVLWVVAFVAPLVAAVVIGWLGSALSDGVGATSAMILVVLSALVVMWLPFRYHVLHARRLGAPSVTMVAWFWAPLIATVGGLSILALGLQDELAADGMSAGDRLVGAVLAYGIGGVVFAMSTWRAITVFDEVIDIRWNRWRTEWEQTLEDMAAQPPPGPELG